MLCGSNGILATSPSLVYTTLMHPAISRYTIFRFEMVAENKLALIVVRGLLSANEKY